MICVSVAEKDLTSCLDAIKHAEIAELRIDQTELSDSELKTFFGQAIKTIATCRPGKYSDSKRQHTIQHAIRSGAHWVDLEIDSANEFLESIIETAKEYSCKIIISYHNYKETPDLKTLQNIVKDCLNKGADIVKIACQVNENKDNSRLLSLYNIDNPVISIGMGELGKITRLAALYLGAPFTYAASNDGKETALGQFTIDKLNEIFSIINSK